MNVSDDRYEEIRRSITEAAEDAAAAGMSLAEVIDAVEAGFAKGEISSEVDP